MTEGKLWELCERADMPSQPTMRKLIRSRPDFPVILYGRKGQDYIFDLEAAEAFVRANWLDGRGGRKRGAAPRCTDDLALPLFDRPGI